MHKTTLYNFTSAQDRRTLNTAQCCLNAYESGWSPGEKAVKQAGRDVLHGWMIIERVLLLKVGSVVYIDSAKAYKHLFEDWS